MCWVQYNTFLHCNAHVADSFLKHVFRIFFSHHVKIIICAYEKCVDKIRSQNPLNKSSFCYHVNVAICGSYIKEIHIWEIKTVHVIVLCNRKTNKLDITPLLHDSHLSSQITQRLLCRHLISSCGCGAPGGCRLRYCGCGADVGCILHLTQTHPTPAMLFRNLGCTCSTNRAI